MRKLNFSICLYLAVVAFVWGQEERTFEPLEYRVEERARRIVLPALDLKEVPLADALRSLEQQGRERDPDHHGVRISTDEMLTEAKKSEKELDVVRTVLRRPITLSLKNISLLEAVTKTAAFGECLVFPKLYGLEIKVNYGSADPLFTHTIPLPAEIFGKSANPEKLGIKQADVEAFRSDPKAFLERYEGYLDHGGNCSFDPKKLMFTVVGTVQELNKIQVILKAVFKERKNGR